MLAFFFVPLFAVAQKAHTVKTKETLYSLARLYKIHPRELAAFNNIPVTTSLSVGQVIKIPATTTMPPLSELPPVKTDPVVKKEPEITREPEVKKEPVIKKETVEKLTVSVKKEVLTPVYHKVAKKENLYLISKLYKNVTIDEIKKWNKLSGDALNVGTNLIVGYTKDPSTKTTEIGKEKKVEDVKEIVKEIPKQVETVKKETEKIIKTEPVKSEEVISPKKAENDNITGRTFNGGLFKTSYEKQVGGKPRLAEEKGQAGIFKSTSGWNDGKYYCLSNSAAAGTYVKITNPANKQVVYAKVLDLIPDLSLNAGLIIRLSNAAAAELGIKTDNFEAVINF